MLSNQPISTKRTRTFEDISGLREDQDAIPIMASILENQIRYHLKTADFEDGVCLIRNIIKGLGAIKKSADLKRNLDWEEVKERTKKEHAGAESLEISKLWSEAHYYEYIVAAAKIRNTQSRAKTPGRIPDYSAAEIEVADEMVKIVSSAENPDTFRKYRSFWKFLHDLRVECEAVKQDDNDEESMLREGLGLILLFQTPKFHRRFFNKTTNALSTVKKWNKVYHPYMRELAARVIAERKGDFSSRSDLQRVDVQIALSHIAPMYWVSSSPWANDEEKRAYQATISYNSSSESQVACGTKIDGDDTRNKAIYVFLVPYEGPPNPKKRKFNGDPVSTIAVAVCPIIPVLSGDFLGVMSGRVRYTTDVGTPAKYVQGPLPNLWLDFSQFTGRLSCMKVAENDDDVNVRLS